MRALMLFNPTAHRGKGSQRLERVRERLAGLDLLEVQTTGSLEGDTVLVRDALDDGIRMLVAAGGDGTVHSVVNAVWRITGGAPPDDIVLGAVGLGSSNDFHKPTRDPVPCRLDFERRAARDVVAVRFEGPSGVAERVFVVSASLGVTAEANAFFNREDRVLRRLKRSFTAAAIPYAALRTIGSFSGYPARLKICGERLVCDVSNLSVLKTPFVSGDLRFDVDVTPDDGDVAVALCDGMTRGELLRTLLALYRGEFTGRQKTRVWRAPALSVDTDRSVPLELDGEIVHAHSMAFQVHHRWLSVCGS